MTERHIRKVIPGQAAHCPSLLPSLISTGLPGPRHSPEEREQTDGSFFREHMAHFIEKGPIPSPFHLFPRARVSLPGAIHRRKQKNGFHPRAAPRQSDSAVLAPAGFPSSCQETLPEGPEAHRPVSGSGRGGRRICPGMPAAQPPCPFPFRPLSASSSSMMAPAMSADSAPPPAAIFCLRRSISSLTVPSGYRSRRSPSAFSQPSSS